jgi:hypothetical protein
MLLCIFLPFFFDMTSIVLINVFVLKAIAIMSGLHVKYLSLFVSDQIYGVLRCPHVRGKESKTMEYLQNVSE